jgi:hypothetical protein
MRSMAVVVLLAVALALSGKAQDVQPGSRWWPWPWRNQHRLCPCCPNDYCFKKMPPCPTRVFSHAPDDYCPKRLPCVKGVKCGGPDDYCHKPCPIFVLPCYPPWYTCGDPVAPLGTESHCTSQLP